MVASMLYSSISKKGMSIQAGRVRKKDLQTSRLIGTREIQMGVYTLFGLSLAMPIAVVVTCSSVPSSHRWSKMEGNVYHSKIERIQYPRS